MEDLNQSELIFPGTELMVIYEFVSK